MSCRTFVAVLSATTILAGAAFAAEKSSSEPPATPPGHAAMVKDFSKLSADGVRAYQDVALARLAIFDGRTADAKKYVDDADAGFDKAKSDDSVFTKAEAEMRTHTTQAGKAGTGDKSGQASSGAATPSAGTAQGDVNKQIAWLPVDGSVTIDQNYTMQPAKAKAVADANKSLAQGDRKGAMEKLKLAEVDTAVTLAVVPLQQTLGDVDQAKQMIDAGKYYEGSQKLRAVQDSTVLTIADIPAVPGKAGSQQGTPAESAPAATH